jgi:hypothetical protein
LNAAYKNFIPELGKEVLAGQPATSVIEMEDFTPGVEQSTNLEIDEVVVLPSV